MNTAETVAFLDALRLRGLLRYAPCGSRIICNPPPTDTDEDWIILFEDGKLEALEYSLTKDGWKTIHGYEFDSLLELTARMDETNLLFTTDQKYYEQWLLAVRVCKYLNLQVKEHRGMVHAILTGEV